MKIHIIASLVIMLPLVASIINGLFQKFLTKKSAGIISAFIMFVASVLAGIVFYHAGIGDEVIHLSLFKWLQIGDINISWAIYIDPLTALMLVVVTSVSMVVHIYSLGYMKDDKNLQKFLSFLSLFTFFMLALVSADNFLQLFFGWEGVGLCSYLLIGYWYEKESANNAAIKAFIVNRASDFAFILGIVLIILSTNCADFAGVFAQGERLANIKYTISGGEISLLDIICLLLFIGCMGKSAQIGLHIWLPDAMEGPTPVSALIHAATMVTAGVFLVARCSYLFEYSPYVLQLIAIVGGVTCLFAATIAIVQKDIKKIIAYSTCSQLGYMFLACGVSAYSAGIFHLVTHAFFKALLFLSAGSVIHAVHEQDIFKIGGLRYKMPITYINFWAGSLAIIGIFPLAGFYSKDLILESAYGAGNTGFAVFILGLLAAILTAVYSMKIIFLTFHGQTRLGNTVFKHAHEASKIMNLPLLILVGGTLFSGMIGYYILGIDRPNGYFSASIFTLHSDLGEHHNLPVTIKLLPLIAGLTGILIGVYFYLYKTVNSKDSKEGFVYKLLENKYYFDEIYYYIFIKPTTIFSDILNAIDYKVIDRFGPNAAANITRLLGIRVSAMQTGYIFNYALYIMLGVVICMSFFIINFIGI